jgi:phosphonate transport system permease protein
MTLRALVVDHGREIAARHGAVLSPGWGARLTMPLVVAALAALLLFGLYRIDFSPGRILAGLDKLGYIAQYMWPPDPGRHLPVYLKALGETVAIALLGTVLGAVLGLPLALLAAKNVVANSLFHFLCRRSLDTIRGVDTLIWALIWINVVGLGPFAGILAIALSDMATFGKLFSEAIEASDRKPVEGISAAGGGRLHGIRFGILPEVAPVMVSQLLYYIESNTRSATIIGIVGAGGIGLHLSDTIRLNEWQNVSFLILMILVTVVAIDWVSTRLRFAMIGRREAPR